MHRALLAVLILLGALHVSCESARAEDASCDTGFGKGAIASCTRLIETRTESTALSIAHNNRGTIYRQMGELDRAIADFNEAIRLDPKYTAAYTNRGRTYELKGDSERARVDFKAALALPQKYDNGKWAHDTARER